MADETNPPFEYDVFVSHSSKDKPVARDPAERLRKAGLKVLVRRVGDPAGRPDRPL